MNTINKKEAKIKGLLHYYTGKACKHGHLSQRLVSTGKCCACQKIYHTRYIKGWQKTNKQKVNNATREWRKNNPDQASAVHKKYYDDNKESKLLYNKVWRSHNKHKLLMYNATRRCSLINATPLWVDLVAIEKIYLEAVTLSKKNEIDYHVDHIYPLNGKTVCGLHVDTNLQIITATENLSKGNKLLD